ncbi:DNA cytosine methyltransferase [Spirulina sp. 06S082]|uniref:DNA cytosine methyltransferase n=1 Tax=Spirulina sp. 06S082 TaxID=3110248 RepID=UPI002B1F5CD9|nr:DNA cytosine methyltransferase [Spirulina sp. 06S082]MEA5467866.1 DNA cytosine methyltransferase [Spirulina sp. 06S082]
MKGLDLFAGCGGLSLGFQNLGFEILAAYDNWQPALEIYRQNFKHKIYDFNLERWHENLDLFRQFNPNFIVGGPPCQDFSSAGKRNENLGNGNLTIAFAKIVVSLLPQIFVMENVAGFQKTEKYQISKNIFQNAGYGISEKILDASLCNVPQKRKSFFWIGIYRGKDAELIPYLEANLAQKSMTVRDYLQDRLGIQYYYRHPRSYQRRGIFSIDEPSPTIRGVNRPIPKTYKNHPGDAALLSSEIRALTTKERSYIQTFPEDFILTGSKTDREQAIGNAVPVKLAEYVAKCILEYWQSRN